MSGRASRCSTMSTRYGRLIRWKRVLCLILHLGVVLWKLSFFELFNKRLWKGKGCFVVKFSWKKCWWKAELLLYNCLWRVDCAPGTWSFNCSLQCRCANNVPCDPRNGFCANGRCADGWSGFSCSNGSFLCFFIESLVSRVEQRNAKNCICLKSMNSKNWIFLKNENGLVANFLTI